MKTHPSLSRVWSALLLPTAALLLCQCAMPPRQAWQYIQTKGLLSYWSYESGRPSPPLRSGYARSSGPLYASGSRSYSTTPRYAYRPSSSGLATRSYGAPNRFDYSQNRYYNPTPSYQAQRSVPAPRPRPSSPAPRVRIEENEPSPAPRIVRNEPPAPAPNTASTAPVPKTETTPAPAPKSAVADLPYGTPVPGRLNMVNSPYAGKTQLVDVSGMGPGQTVKCPYSGKLFKVPAAQEATNNTESRLESKVEPSKSGEKKP